MQDRQRPEMSVQRLGAYYFLTIISPWGKWGIGNPLTVTRFSILAMVFPTINMSRSHKTPLTATENHETLVAWEILAIFGSTADVHPTLHAQHLSISIFQKE